MGSLSRFVLGVHAPVVTTKAIIARVVLLACIVVTRVAVVAFVIIAGITIVVVVL